MYAGDVRYIAHHGARLRVEDGDQARAQVRDIQPMRLRVEALIIEARGAPRQRHVTDDPEACWHGLLIARRSPEPAPLKETSRVTGGQEDEEQERCRSSRHERPSVPGDSRFMRRHYAPPAAHGPGRRRAWASSSRRATSGQFTFSMNAAMYCAVPAP